MANHSIKDRKTSIDHTHSTSNLRVFLLRKMYHYATLFRGGYTMFHVNLAFDGWKPKIQILDHDQVAKDKEIELNKLSSRLIPEKFAEKVFGNMQSYDFAIFFTHRRNTILLSNFFKIIRDIKKTKTLPDPIKK